MTNEQKFLNVAVKSVRQAGKIFKNNFGKAKTISKKGGDPRDLVTEVDRKIEKIVTHELLKTFPSHAILGEEFGLTSGKNGNQYKWFIDPIDGTSNFIQGMPMACISLALWKNNKPVVGVIFNPVLGTIYTAARGKGASKNGKKIQVNKTDKLIKAYGGFGWGRNVKIGRQYYPIFIKKVLKLRSLGSTASDCCLLAEGVYDFHFQAEFKIWDVAAAAVIVAEAGGKITDWQGKPITLKTKHLIASTKPLHKTLLKIVK